MLFCVVYPVCIQHLVPETCKIENSTEFLYEMLHNFFGGKSLENSSVQFFAKNVARGNSVQNGPNFPAKSLGIYTKITMDTI